jgi:RNA polymerase sigma factor (sigma-70 family)
MSNIDDGIVTGREEFLALVADIRPELHRYCARLTGSMTDGEDIVQEALVRAFFALPELDTLPGLRPWLFRIAHNRAIDHTRGNARLSAVAEELPDRGGDAIVDDPLESLLPEDIVHPAASRLSMLPPTQRSVLMLKDVLGHSLEDIATLLDMRLGAVKAALHRGRIRLRELNRAKGATPERESTTQIKRYVALLSARDWEGLRILLTYDVRLDQTLRAIRASRTGVSKLLTKYSEVSASFRFGASRMLRT